MISKKLMHWHIITAGLAIYDAFAVNIAFFLALWLRFDCRISMIEPQYLEAFIAFAPIYTVLTLIVFSGARLYRSIWRFASFDELIRVTVVTGITFIIQSVGITLFFCRMPISYYLIGIILQFLAVLIIRFSYRFVLLLRSGQEKGKGRGASRVMLVGAGVAGQMILHDTIKAKEIQDKVFCIIDDNPNKWGRYIEGVPVVGGRNEILECVNKYHISKIYIAIPSASAEAKREILEICKETDCELKNLPGIYQLVNGDVTVSKMKDVDIEDLLGRETIQLVDEEVFSYIKGKKILVTGGGGSIGSELCRQIAARQPKQLIIFDIYENNAYEIQQELKRKYPQLDVKTLMGSVRDSRRIEEVFALSAGNRLPCGGP